MDDVTPNDVVAFMVEVAAFVLLAVWGWRQGDTTVTRWAWAVAVPLGAALLWGLFAAPRSRFDVLALGVATKVVVLGGALLAGRTILSAPVWWGLAAVVLANTVLLYVGPWSRERGSDSRGLGPISTEPTTTESDTDRSS